MRNKKILIPAICVILITLLSVAFKPVNVLKPQQEVGKSNSFAVVELFTSEGCSSCPPADRLLGNIIKEAQSNNKRIFALAFHVDYWNDLGWRDIYSQSAYSRRQRNYARALRSSVYTPQMIVNGKDQFVGSNRSKARQTINKSLKNAAPLSVTLRKVDARAHKVNLNYTIKGDFGGSVLNLAVVERKAVRHIKRGENSGLTMHHENVVRAFDSLRLEQRRGTASLEMPQDVDINNASVIVYIQNPTTKKIIGAAGKNLPSAQS